MDDNDRPKYVGVKTGLLGTRSTLIPTQLVRINDKRKLIEVEVDKNTIKEGPIFGDDRQITSEFEQRVLGYYRTEITHASAEREADVAYYQDATGNKRVDLRPEESPTETPERSGNDQLSAARSGRDHQGGDEFTSEDELRVQRVEEELSQDQHPRTRGRRRTRAQAGEDRSRASRRPQKASRGECGTRPS